MLWSSCLVSCVILVFLFLQLKLMKVYLQDQVCVSLIVNEDKADCIHVHNALHMNSAHLYVRTNTPELTECTVSGNDFLHTCDSRAWKFPR